MLALGIGLAAACAPAAGQATRPAADDVAAAIAGLADESFSRREAAQRHLLESGMAVEPQLRRALAESKDEEQRSRLETILKRVAEDSIVGPTRVSLSAENLSAVAAIEAIAEQSGVRIQLFPADLWQADAAPPVSVQAERSPLWLVLRRLCEQLALEPTVTDDGVRLIPSTGCGMTRGPATVAGPLLVSASRLSRLQAIDFSQGGTRNDEFTLTFNVLAEPKLRVMPGPAAVQVTEAVDDAGNALVSGRDAPEVSYNSGGPAWSFATRLRYPSEQPGRRIERMAGTITLPVAMRFATLEVSDVTQPGPHVMTAAAGLEDGSEWPRFAVRSITQTGERWEVNLSAAAPRGRNDAFNRLQQLLYNPDVRLLDADGRSILRSSGPNFTSSDAPNALFMTLVFDRNLSDGRPTPGTARSLVWRVPVETRQVTLPFEIRDLPMP